MSVKPWRWEHLPTRTVGGTPKLIDELSRPLTFEDYADLREIDGEPPPIREEYDAFMKEEYPPGEIGVWLGVRFIE